MVNFKIIRTSRQDKKTMKRYNFEAVAAYDGGMIEDKNGEFIKYKDAATILRGAKILLQAAQATTISVPTSKRIKNFTENRLKEI